MLLLILPANSLSKLEAPQKRDVARSCDSTLRYSEPIKYASNDYNTIASGFKAFIILVRASLRWHGDITSVFLIMSAI